LTVEFVRRLATAARGFILKPVKTSELVQKCRERRDQFSSLEP
jgi:hypothetical protein